MKSLSDGVLEGLRAALDEPDLSGTRYELVDRLGRGGMGSVFRVRVTRDRARARLEELR